MGFGSYDESEQRDQDYGDDDDDEAVNVHDDEFEGTMAVDSGASTEDLIGRLQDIKDDQEE